MSKAFQHLLLPAETFSWRKDAYPADKEGVYPKEYSSGLFYLTRHKEGDGFLWFWEVQSIDLLSLNLEDEQHIEFLEEIQTGHQVWQDARDEIISILESFMFEKIDTKVIQSVPNRYYLKSSVYPDVRTDVNIFRRKSDKRWQLTAYNTGSIKYVPQLTKQKALQYLYAQVSNNLFDIAAYSFDKELYEEERKQVIDALSSETQLAQDIKFWWMMFIKPEVDIVELFKF